MRRGKADRWDLLVHKLVRQQDYDSYFHGSLIAQLLRREHRAMVRIIQRAHADYIDSEYRHVCQEVLDILKRRAL